MVRLRDFNLAWFGAFKPMMFDLATDPGEQNNIFDSAEPIVAAARETLQKPRNTTLISDSCRKGGRKTPSAYAIFLHGTRRRSLPINIRCRAAWSWMRTALSTRQRSSAGREMEPSWTFRLSKDISRSVHESTFQ